MAELHEMFCQQTQLGKLAPTEGNGGQGRGGSARAKVYSSVHIQGQNVSVSTQRARIPVV